MHNRRLLPTIAVSLFILLNGARSATAGGGPENVFLVVNSADEDSRTIANHYCNLRRIPPSNVFETKWEGSDNVITVNQFRKTLLADILAEISKRRLTKQIDQIVYSAGFPYAVDILPDFKNAKPVSQDLRGRYASLTGMTFLHEAVRKKDLRYANYQAQVNHYFANGNRRSSGFSGQHTYSRIGRTNTNLGTRYYLSTMLGYTAGRGNTVDEVIRYLSRSATADGTTPRGTIYFMQNPDPRSVPRHPNFDAVAALLNRAGVRAEVIAGDAKPIGVLPIKKNDVAGAMVGYASFNWASSGSKILPGAICENLTSYGGVLKAGGGQTPLTEFLRHGAAGSSGAVWEPYSIQAKFPHPLIHLRYANGCSLAESFYQSVSNPYQLIIVGDPLCRPWAKIPRVHVEGLKANQRVKGKVTLTPKAASPVPIRRFRLFVDGRLATECQAGESLTIDTTKLPNGYHDLRIVGIDPSPVETQGRLIVPIFVENTKRSIDVQASPSNQIQYGDRFRVQVNAPGAAEIMVYHRRRALAAASLAKANITIDSRDIGSGPVELTVVARADGKGAGRAWFANPLKLEIIPARTRRQSPITTTQR